jgi:hypothetical protein
MGRHARFILFRDRNGAWCAAPPGFCNLVRDPTGWGATRVEAVRELLAHPEYVHRAQRGEWPRNPGLAAFLEVPEPEGAMFTGREPEPAASFWEAAMRRQSLKLVWDRGRRA